MNKSELVKEVTEKVELNKKDVEKVLGEVLGTIEDTLAKGEKVQLTGFGTFEPRERKEKLAPAHPGKAGDKEKKTVPATIVPAFKASKEFKEKVAK